MPPFPAIFRIVNICSILILNWYHKKCFFSERSEGFVVFLRSFVFVVVMIIQGTPQHGMVYLMVCVEVFSTKRGSLFQPIYLGTCARYAYHYTCFHFEEK